MNTKEASQAAQESQTWPKVAIIVLNWNGWRDTIECLESLKGLNYPNYEVIVVDNGSTDDSVARIRQNFPEVILIETGKNLGYAGGNNRGIEYSLERGADYVMIINNDTRVDRNALKSMVQVAIESDASVTGALIKDPNGNTCFAKSKYPAMLFYSEPQRKIPSKRWWESDQVNGSAMLLRRDALLERKASLGYFLDESLFLYCEEIELGIWCRRVGRKSVMAGDAVVYHKVGASSDKALQFYYLTRNRVLLAHRYLTGVMGVVFDFFFPCWRIIRAIIYMAQGRRSIARAIIRGLVDGYKGKTGPTHDRAKVR